MSEFQGNILIYIEGYTVEEWRCMEHNDPDSWHSRSGGWAVGNNPRDRYCARTSPDKIRRFQDYDETVSYIYNKKKKFPKQSFQLIYEIDNQRLEVSSLDGILAIDAEKLAKKSEVKQAQKEMRDKELPCIDLLLGKYNSRKAFAASSLLRDIRECGKIEAMNQYNKSTFYKLFKLLKDENLVM